MHPGSRAPASGHLVANEFPSLQSSRSTQHRTGRADLDGDLVQASWLHCCCESSRVREAMSLCQPNHAGISCPFSDCAVQTAHSLSSRDREGYEGTNMLARAAYETVPCTGVALLLESSHELELLEKTRLVIKLPCRRAIGPH